MHPIVIITADAYSRFLAWHAWLTSPEPASGPRSTPEQSPSGTEVLTLGTPVTPGNRALLCRVPALGFVSDSQIRRSPSTQISPAFRAYENMPAYQIQIQLPTPPANTLQPHACSPVDQHRVGVRVTPRPVAAYWTACLALLQERGGQTLTYCKFLEGRCHEICYVVTRRA